MIQSYKISSYVFYMKVINMVMLIILYFSLLLILPIIIDSALSYIHQKNNKNKLDVFIDIAIKNNKKLLLCGPYCSYLISFSNNCIEKIKSIRKNINVILTNVSNDKYVIYAYECLEYCDDINKLIYDIKRVSGNKFIIINMPFDNCHNIWNCRIKHRLANSYYTASNCSVKYYPIDDTCAGIRQIYEYVFKFIPYECVKIDMLFFLIKSEKKS